MPPYNIKPQPRLYYQSLPFFDNCLTSLSQSLVELYPLIIHGRAHTQTQFILNVNKKKNSYH